MRRLLAAILLLALAICAQFPSARALTEAEQIIMFGKGSSASGGGGGGGGANFRITNTGAFRVTDTGASRVISP